MPNVKPPSPPSIRPELFCSAGISFLSRADSGHGPFSSQAKRQRSPARDKALPSRQSSRCLLGVGVGAKRQVVVERLPGELGFKPQWRSAIVATDRSFPEVEVAENLFDNFVLLDQ